MKVMPWELYKFLEVFQVVEWAGNTIKRTKTTGKYIYKKDEYRLDAKKFTTTSPSTKLTSAKDVVELDMFSFPSGD